jgi:hypothetical protein
MALKSVRLWSSGKPLHLLNVAHMFAASGGDLALLLEVSRKSEIGRVGNAQKHAQH